MPNTLLTYKAAREQLLIQITDTLRRDDRFVAAWLTGSYGRSEEDEVSDLDLNVVVADAYVEDLCTRPQMVQTGTTPPRLALISQFGQPTVLHENHFNAPAGGSFTFVLYAESALMVDWILIPQAQAQQPTKAQLLFDKLGIPIQPVADFDTTQRCQMLAEKEAFFWMMLAVTAKYMARRDMVKVQGFLDILHHVLRDIEHLLAEQYPEYHRGSLMSVQATYEEQLTTCRNLMARLADMRPKIINLGATLPPMPVEAIGRLFDLQ